MDAANVVLLTSELRAQLLEIDRIFELAEQRGDVAGAPGTESLAYQLHNLYCAYEDLLEMVAAAFENHIDPKGGYHIELLKRMRIEVLGVRPSLLTREAFDRLDALRSFRHFVRHAYGTDLDDRRVRLVLDDARAALPLVRRDIEQFIQRLSGEMPGSDV